MALLPADHGPLFQGQTEDAQAWSQEVASYDLDRDMYELIELLLEEKGAIGSSDAQHLTGLDAASVRPYLQQLVEEGKARVEGQRRGTRYHRIAYGKA
jgi:Fic family protein